MGLRELFLFVRSNIVVEAPWEGKGVGGRVGGCPTPSHTHECVFSEGRGKGMRVESGSASPAVLFLNFARFPLFDF